MKARLSLGLCVAAMSVVHMNAAYAAETESVPAEIKLVSVEAYPPAIALNGKFVYRQLVLLGRSDAGETVDLTRVATLEGQPTTIQFSPTGLVRPLANGSEELSFRYGDFVVRVPCQVSGTEQEPQISFVRDMAPALSRMNCNAGTCHGSREGKNGFKLSLRGYDALYDHRALTDDIAARRFNRAAPEQSLFLLKATGSIPHVGGVRTRVGEPYYEIMRAWIMQGAKLDLDSPRVKSLEIQPQNPVVPRANMQQQMVVLATYTDGTVRDVTKEAFVESGNTEVIAAGDGGILKMLRRGQAPVLVRYEGAYAATILSVMGDRSGFAWSDPPIFNYVDEHVYAKLQRMKILPSEVCTDQEFIRRVYLDLTGLPPGPEAIRAFVADTRPMREKRDALVDALIGSPEYVEYWTNKWADLLQVNRKFLGEEGAVTLRNWIKSAVAENKPYNEFAAEILTASGSTLDNPAAAYFKILRTPAEAMENTTHLFLAIRFNCNKCHDHPFERWTQDQYYHLAAYFAQVGLKEDPRFSGQTVGGSAVEGAKPLVEVVFDSGAGEVTHDRTGQVTAPSFPFTFGDAPAAELPRRQQLAQWLTSEHNPYFARSYVNRLWGYLFGGGIIEPIDDIRAGNPATNPELLEALTNDFVNSGFDARHILATICKSRAYQHSVVSNQWNVDDKTNCSHAIPRRLPAEVLFDALYASTGATPRIPGAPAGFRAAELPDAGVSIPFLDDFGRPPRESACECERSSGMVLGPVMKLVNGPTVADALSQSDNALSKLVAGEQDDGKLVEEVFMRILCRLPTDAEKQLSIEAIQNAGDDYEVLTKALADYEQQVDARQPEWEQRLASVQWTPLKPREAKSEVGAQFAIQDDASVLVSGPNGKDTYTIVLDTDQQHITGIRLEALNDPALPGGGPGRSPYGNFVLTEFRLTAAPKNDPAQAKKIALVTPTASFSQDGLDPGKSVDGNSEYGWAIYPRMNERHVAVFETAEDATAEGGLSLTFELEHKFADSQHSLGKFRIAVTSAPRPVRYQDLPDNIASLLAIPSDQRSEEQKAELTNYHRSQDAEWLRLRDGLQQGESTLKNRRLVGVQDLAWALINTPSFLFNR